MTTPTSSLGASDMSERAPEPPPAGPWRWMRENLFSGHTWGQIAFNTFLTLVFALLLLNILRFITSYLFAPERKWAAVTHNAKLLMVQAFPQDDLIRIWTSLGIFMVLVVWSLASWKVGGRLEFSTFAGGVRSAAVLVAVTAIMHHAAETRTYGIPILQFDSPAGWSAVRTWILLAAVLTAVLAHFAIRRSRAADPSPTIPVLTVPVMIMAAVAALLWTVKLPVPLGQFDQTTAPIAATTARPWTLLFVLAVVAYPLGLLIERIWPRAFRRFLISAWILSYPVIIFIIQRNPVLDWSDMIMLLAVVLGAGALRVLVLLPRGPTATAVVMGIGLVTAALPFASGEEPLWVTAGMALIGLAILIAALTIEEPVEMVRAAAAGLVLACLLIWFIPMPFLYRILIITFTLFLLAAPRFGVTQRGRTNLVRAWIAGTVLIVVAFRLEATASDGSSLTTFLGSDVVSIVMAVVLGGGALRVLSLLPEGADRHRNCDCDRAGYGRPAVRFRRGTALGDRGDGADRVGDTDRRPDDRGTGGNGPGSGCRPRAGLPVDLVHPDAIPLPHTDHHLHPVPGCNAHVRRNAGGKDQPGPGLGSSRGADSGGIPAGRGQHVPRVPGHHLPWGIQSDHPPGR